MKVIDRSWTWFPLHGKDGLEGVLESDPGELPVGIELGIDCNEDGRITFAGWRLENGALVRLVKPGLS